MNERRFLFLQGPMGSFFKKLAARLREQGHSTLRVNFNGGDWLHFMSRHTVNFYGTLAQWPDALEQMVATHRITDLVLYGDCRPLHRIAIDQLRARGIRIHVFEEGYFRPQWITLEEGGVNGFSPLPRSAEGLSEAALRLNITHEKDMPHFGPSFARLARHTISYYLASFLLRARFRHYRSHRPRTYQKEGLAWLLRLTENYVMARFIARRVRRVIENQNPYFLLLLQLLGDAQITHHSHYHDMYEFLDEVLQDFAAHAPPNTRLVVKNHPLDNGLNRYGAFLRQKTRSLGLGDRLVYLDGGHLPTLLREAKGVVTVNSTAGLSALHYHVPVRTFGRAVYAIDGLVSHQPLAEFWHHPRAPDETLHAIARRVIISQSQIYGGFYRRDAISSAVTGSMTRLLGAAPAIVTETAARVALTEHAA